MNHIVLEVQNINRTFANGTIALQDVSFSVKKGELAVVLGSSGAGKTTALNILGGMDTATSGKVFVDGENSTKLKGNNFYVSKKSIIRS